MHRDRVCACYANYMNFAILNLNMIISRLLIKHYHDPLVNIFSRSNSSNSKYAILDQILTRGQSNGANYVFRGCAFYMPSPSIFLQQLPTREPVISNSIWVTCAIVKKCPFSWMGHNWTSRRSRITTVRSSLASFMFASNKPPKWDVLRGIKLLSIASTETVCPNSLANLR